MNELRFRFGEDGREGEGERNAPPASQASHCWAHPTEGAGRTTSEHALIKLMGLQDTDKEFHIIPKT